MRVHLGFFLIQVQMYVILTGGVIIEMSIFQRFSIRAVKGHCTSEFMWSVTPPSVVTELLNLETT